MTLKLNESPAHSIGNNRLKCVNTDPMTRTKNMGRPPFTEIYDFIIWLGNQPFKRMNDTLNDIFQFVVNKNNIFFSNSCTKHICVDTFFQLRLWHLSVPNPITSMS